MSDARKKTIDRKKALLAAAAALEIACSKSTGATDMGYAVVDPMPTPARCPGLENELKPTAKILADGTIELTLPAPPATVGTLSRGAAPVVTGATLMKTTTAPDSTVLILKTDADSGTTMPNVDVQVHGSCTGTSDVTLHVTVNVRPPDVSVSVYEQRY
jgi:hypothetical protein